MTRMWCVDPSLLCRNHLLGEHKEIHQLIGTINHGRWNQVEGLARKNCIDTSQIIDRHDDLVAEMLSRRFKHESPLPEFEVPAHIGSVDPGANLEELKSRCPACSKRQMNREMAMTATLEEVRPKIEQMCRILAWKWSRISSYDELISEAYFNFTRFYLSSNEVWNQQEHPDFGWWICWKIRYNLLDYLKVAKKDQGRMIRATDLLTDDAGVRGGPLLETPVIDRISEFPYDDLSESARQVIDLILSNHLRLLEYIFEVDQGKATHLKGLKKFLYWELGWSLPKIKRTIREIRSALASFKEEEDDEFHLR